MNVSVNESGGISDQMPPNCTHEVTHQRCDPVLLGLETFIKILDLYLIPVIILVGLVGNILSFMVFFSTYLRRLSSSVYLAALAVTDVGYLVNLFFSWLGNFGASMWDRHGWCNYFVYATYVTSFLSVWYVVCFTIERCLVVSFPLQRQVFCRPSRAKIVVVAFAVVALVGYSYSVFTVHIEMREDGPQCYPVLDYLPLAMTMSNVDTVVTLVIPALVIVLSNLRIAYALSRFYRTRRAIDLTVRRRAAQQAGGSGARCSSSGSSSSASARAAVAAAAAASSNISGLSSGRAVITSANSNSSYNRLQMKVTKMLLLVSTVFLGYNIPSHLIRVYVLVAPQPNEPRFLLHLMQKLSMIIYYAGFASNFVLYSISGKTFRKAFFRMWRCFGHRLAACLYAKYVALRWRSKPHLRTRSNPTADVYFKMRLRENAYS